MSEIKQMRQKANWDLLLELSQKSKVYAEWKQGQVAWEQYSERCCSPL